MFLTIHAALGLPGADERDWVDAVLGALDPHKVSLGAAVARSAGEARGHAVVLWDAADDADRALDPQPLRVGDVRLGAGTRFEVTAAARPADPGPARCVQVLEFVGPRTAEWLAAFERAGRERLWPATRDVPGLAAVLTGVAADGGCVTLSFADSREALGTATQRIMTTALLPGERPELLTGPDRWEIQQVVHADLPDHGWTLS